MSNLPIYYVFIVNIPVGIANTMNPFKEVPFEGGYRSTSSQLLRWDKVTRKTSEGSLGTGRIIDRKQAMLGKWLWRSQLKQMPYGPEYQN